MNKLIRSIENSQDYRVVWANYGTKQILMANKTTHKKILIDLNGGN